MVKKDKKCKKHPKYNGKKKPSYECTECLQYYLLLKNKPRAPILPTKVIKDKKKYDRNREKQNGRKGRN